MVLHRDVVASLGFRPTSIIGPANTHVEPRAFRKPFAATTVSSNRAVFPFDIRRPTHIAMGWIAKRLFAWSFPCAAFARRGYYSWGRRRVFSFPLSFGFLLSLRFAS